MTYRIYPDDEIATDEIILSQVEDEGAADYYGETAENCDTSDCIHCSPEQRAHCNRREDDQLSFDEDF
jgi:hypothetical protein